MLQAASQMANRGCKVLYVSGEESLAQIKLRADRCQVQENENLKVSNGTTLEFLSKLVDELNPQVIVCDSIQVMTAEGSFGLAGSVAQIREVSSRLIHLAKYQNIAVFLIGHVTKDGQLAGPKLLEHAVDTVLYFEHTPTDHLRILRAHKNRFGPTFEVGIFEMEGLGLTEVKDPSSLFMHPFEGSRVGSVFYPSIQGTRPIILEVQALCSPCQFGAPRRQGEGMDNSRVALIAAILEKSLKLRFSAHDVFVNLVGGVIEKDPALDLAVALCLISSYKQKPISPKLVVCGECGLTGEVRRVSQFGRRIKEALSLQLAPVLMPDVHLTESSSVPEGSEIHGIKHVTGLAAWI
jgi:DNA repair protein RadA/Sms